MILCFQLTKFFIRYIAWLGNGDIINKAANVTRKNGRVSRWSPSPRMPEIIKINIDGPFLVNQKKGSWGFIARDHEGSVGSWLALDQ